MSIESKRPQKDWIGIVCTSTKISDGTDNLLTSQADSIQQNRNRRSNKNVKQRRKRRWDLKCLHSSYVYILLISTWNPNFKTNLQIYPHDVSLESLRGVDRYIGPYNILIQHNRIQSGPL